MNLMNVGLDGGSNDDRRDHDDVGDVVCFDRMMVDMMMVMMMTMMLIDHCCDDDRYHDRDRDREMNHEMNRDDRRVTNVPSVDHMMRIECHELVVDVMALIDLL
jgi:hypothetical protein